MEPQSLYSRLSRTHTLLNERVCLSLVFSLCLRAREPFSVFDHLRDGLTALGCASRCRLMSDALFMKGFVLQFAEKLGQVWISYRPRDGETSSN